MARYLEDLAGAWHRFYDAARVLPQGDEPVTDLTRARLWLVEAARKAVADAAICTMCHLGGFSGQNEIHTSR